MQLGFRQLLMQNSVRRGLPDEMIQPILTLFQEPRPEARHNALARELWYTAVGVGEGTDEVLAKAVELGVSGECWSV